jgi:hypothetical protein
MNEPDIICEMCTNWQVFQRVRRELPVGNEYIIHQDWKDCIKGYYEVINGYCPDYSRRGD